MLHAFTASFLTVLLEYINLYSNKVHVTSVSPDKFLCCVTLFCHTKYCPSCINLAKFSRRGFQNPTGCTVCYYKSQIQSSNVNNKYLFFSVIMTNHLCKV